MHANFLVHALKLGQVSGPALGKLGRAEISKGGLSRINRNSLLKVLGTALKNLGNSSVGGTQNNQGLVKLQQSPNRCGTV